LVPVIPMLVMLKLPVPVLLSLTDWAALVVPTVWLVKVRLVGDKDTVGDPLEVPDPVRLTVCGLPLALSVMVRVPLRVPVAVGVKVTLIAQVEPAATPLPQLFVSAKSPVVAMLEKCTGVVPLLVKVTACAALVVPTAWLANVKLVVDCESAGVKPIFVAKASP
jgi:hypothetical protein